MIALVTLVWAFPAGWRIPFYNDGRARVTNGPGEGLHTGVSAQAMDFAAHDTWATTKDVRAAHAGTVKLARFYTCPGNVVAIEQTSGGNASFYYHLEASIVSEGQVVSRGQHVADYDNSGSCSGGPHLHFEARSGVNWSNPLNTGTPVVTKDLRGIGFYPWWPNASRNSGFVVQSTSHTFEVCSTNRNIYARWPLYTWVVGGTYIDGYSWSWTTSSSTIPDTVKEAEETTFSTTSSALANSTNWYFHLRVRDTSGNWTQNADVAHLGPFWISYPNCPQR